MARLSENLIVQLSKRRVSPEEILRDLGTPTGANSAARAAAASTESVLEWLNKGQKGLVSYRLRKPAPASLRDKLCS